MLERPAIYSLLIIILWPYFYSRAFFCIKSLEKVLKSIEFPCSPNISSLGGNWGSLPVANRNLALKLLVNFLKVRFFG